MAGEGSNDGPERTKEDVEVTDVAVGLTGEDVDVPGDGMDSDGSSSLLTVGLLGSDSLLSIKDK